MVSQLAEEKFQVVSLVFGCEAIVTIVILQAVIVQVWVPCSSWPEEFSNVAGPLVEKFE